MDVHFCIDSNSRFSPIGCDKCSSAVWSSFDTSQMTKEERQKKLQLEYDEEDHYNGVPYYALLPHNSMAINLLDAKLIGDNVMYNGKQVLNLSSIKKFYKGIKYVDRDEDDKEEAEYAAEKAAEKAERIKRGWTIEYNEYDNVDIKSDCLVDCVVDNLRYYDYGRYYLYVTTDTKEEWEKTNEKIDDTILFETMLYFDGNPMTNAHIHIQVIFNNYSLSM